VAIRLGVNNQWKNMSGLLLQSTYNQLSHTAGDAYPIAGGIIRSMLADTLKDFDSGAAIGSYPGCLFQYHSEDDEWIRFKDAQTLFSSATNARSSCTEFVRTQGLKHDDPQGETEKKALKPWLASIRA
jgi:hypothetical protein